MILILYCLSRRQIEVWKRIYDLHWLNLCNLSFDFKD